MLNRPRILRDCECDCHNTDTRCDDCKKCLVQDEDILSIETMDNLPGPGRGLDNIYQFLGTRLDRFLGVVADKLGYGPAAEERNALSAISKLSTGREVSINVVRGKIVVQVSEVDILRLQERIRKSCKKLAKHLRSEAPKTQLDAMNALWRLRCADPVRVDDIYRKLELVERLHEIHEFLSYMNDRSSNDVLALWKSEYVRPYDDALLDGLLASSRKALIAVKDNKLHSVAKSLLQLKGRHLPWIPEQYIHAAPGLQTLSRFLLDPDLAFMAVAYIAKLGLERSADADESMFVVCASVVQSLRAVYSSQVACASKGQAVSNAFWNVMFRFGMIDDLKVFLPIERQQLISDAPMQTDSPIVVDWENLQRAIDQAWVWLYIELFWTARSEGYHSFWERRRPEITGISQESWEYLKDKLARFWFHDFMEDTFKSHYVCAECVDKNRCEYWKEAFNCYWKGGIDNNEVIEEFQRNCKETSRAYALAQMNKWQRHAVFTHEHGKRMYWVRERPI